MWVHIGVCSLTLRVITSQQPHRCSLSAASCKDTDPFPSVLLCRAVTLVGQGAASWSGPSTTTCTLLHPWSAKGRQQMEHSRLRQPHAWQPATTCCSSRWASIDSTKCQALLRKITSIMNPCTTIPKSLACCITGVLLSERACQLWVLRALKATCRSTGGACCATLLLLQVLCNLFLLQLAVVQYDKPQATSDLIGTLTALLEQLEAQHEQGQQQSSDQAPMQVDQQQQQVVPTAADATGVQSRHLAYMKLHFCMLQLMNSLQFGHFKELYPKQGEEQPGSHVPPIVEELDELLQQLTDVPQQQGQPSSAAAAQPQFEAPYEWLPLPALAAAVHILAAVIDKAAGRRKQGLTRISRGRCGA